VKNGVPFDVAFSLSPDERANVRLTDAEIIAFGIIISEINGAEFDFSNWRFKEKK
jgi:hypothetical protein